MRGVRDVGLFALVALTLNLLGASCTVYRKGWPPPVFPDRVGTTVLHILDPLHGPIVVEATVQGENGKERTLWMLVDSGMSEIALPALLAKDLGLRELARSRMKAVGGYGMLGVVVVPHLALADLPLSTLIVGLLPTGGAGGMMDDRGILGQSVLRHAPWEVAWERGTLTLGTVVPWGDGGDVLSLPLHRFEYRADEVDVLLNGHPVKMLFDTGATMSSVPEDLAAALGLPAEPARAGAFIMGGAGHVTVARIFKADLTLGSARFEGRRFIGLPAGEPALLGLDILSRFDLQVVPGQRLLLRPRGDLRATASDRIRRWPWIPPCPSPSCVQARIAPFGKSARLDLVIEAQLPRAVELVLECAESATGHEVLNPAALPKPVNKLGPSSLSIIVDLPSTRPGPVSVDVSLQGNHWFTGDGAGCRDLAVIDVVPAVPDRLPSARTYARISR